MNSTNFNGSFLYNKNFRRTALVIVIVIIILYVKLISGYSLTNVKSILFVAKWVSIFFTAYYAILVLCSYFKHAPKVNGFQAKYLRLETIPLVYIGFAVTYIAKGALSIDTIPQTSWSISVATKDALKPVEIEFIWNMFEIYQTYLPLMLGGIFMALIINCARSYYQIHEFDTGKGMLAISKDSQRSRIGAQVDWVFRIVIAFIFICFEKKISNIGALSEMDVSSIFLELSKFSYWGFALYSFIILWALITQYYFKIRSHHLTQYWIGLGGLIFSVTLWLMVNVDEPFGVKLMAWHMAITLVMTMALLASGGAIILDFITPQSSRKKHNVANK